MEVNSVENLCQYLIIGAFKRCRMLDDCCKISVSLKPSPPNLIDISVSDTGVGSSLVELQSFRCEYPALVCKWDGVLQVATTRISDEKIYHSRYDVKESPSRRLVNLKSTPKNGATFSGTEVIVSVFEQIDGLMMLMYDFIQKMLALKYPRIAFDLYVHSGDGLQFPSRSMISQNASSVLPMNARNVDYLKLGFEDYCMYRNKLLGDCGLSPRLNLKVGSGTAVSENAQYGEKVVDVVIIISDVSRPTDSSCSRKTEVLYYENFIPSAIHQASLEVLSGFEWKNYGLSLNRVEDKNGVMLLEWENFPAGRVMDIVLHRYHNNVEINPPPRIQNSQLERSLISKAIKLALDEFKEKNAGVLLSERANKICEYVPELAKSLSGLISSSNDMYFKEECGCLLELQKYERVDVENCIKEKLIYAISTDDRSRIREGSTMLFADDDDDGYMEDEGEEERLQYMDDH